MAPEAEGRGELEIITTLQFEEGGQGQHGEKPDTVRKNTQVTGSTPWVLDGFSKIGSPDDFSKVGFSEQLFCCFMPRFAKDPHLCA